MPPATIPEHVHFVGIKGTGMSALAELYHRNGVVVTGSDTSEQFYTDAVLQSLGIPFSEGFSPENLPPDAELLIYSAAYDPETHPEILAAKERRLPVLVYTEALGRFSEGRVSVGISGVHGKTSTTAMAGTLVEALGLTGSVLAGSAVSDFGGTSVLVRGNDFFIAETCEYRRHFLDFHPSVIVITNVEADHLDYFRDAADVELAFIEYGRLLPEGGTLVYCSEDAGATAVALALARERDDVRFIGYRREGMGLPGPAAMSAGPDRLRSGPEINGAGPAVQRLGPGGITRGPEVQPLGPGGNAPAPGVGGLGPAAAKFESVTVIGEHAEVGRLHFAIDGIEAAFALTVPGRHNVLNAAAAVIAVSEAAARRLGGDWREFAQERRGALTEGLLSFSGSRRRSELIGETGGIRVMDDYGHHPTEIATTLEGLREFYEPQRLIVDFMSHTFTRTARLLDTFATSFEAADLVVINEIYASAREQFDGTIGGADLADAIATVHPNVVYRGTHAEAEAYLLDILQPGDLLLTLGAGDNWQIGREVLSALQKEQRSQ